jgi:hypothetical protein
LGLVFGRIRCMSEDVSPGGLQDGAPLSHPCLFLAFLLLAFCFERSNHATVNAGSEDTIWRDLRGASAGHAKTVNMAMPCFTFCAPQEPCFECQPSPWCAVPKERNKQLQPWRDDEKSLLPRHHEMFLSVLVSRLLLLSRWILREGPSCCIRLRNHRSSQRGA